MDATELFKRVRQIEIKTRGLSRHIFQGEYHSVFKGKGMAFSEVREYQYGDDVRAIDWNVTARFNHPFIKVFEEERELTVMLLVDVSASHDFGTRRQFKRDMITEIAAVLSFSAIHNKDKVGVIFFSDRIEKFIPPKKGSSHILRIIRELVDFQALHSGTNITEALKYFTNVIKKRCTAFLISDFIDQGFEDAMKIAGNKHDLIALRIYDKRENDLPKIGLLKVQDAETGKLGWVDTRKNSVRSAFLRQGLLRETRLSELFRRSGVDAVAIATDQDYVRPLINFFRKRATRQ